MIELKNVTKIYKSKKNLPTKVLDDVNLKVGNNGMIFIVGKSGSGKSTLLNLLGGLDSVTSGDIIIDNKKMSRFKTSDYDSYRNNYVGFIFQDYNNLDELTVLENITLNEEEKTKEMDIYDLKNRKMNELSGGEKQRVAIARALFKDSKIILADEPTGNLDSKNAKNIMEILKKISNEKLVIVVTHDIEFAKIYADNYLSAYKLQKNMQKPGGIYEKI